MAKKIVSKGSRPQMSEWEEKKPGDVGIKRYRLPLDSEGNPAPGFQPIDITKTEGEPEFGGRLTKSIKGTTEKSDQGINININKRRVKTDDVKYDQTKRRFFDREGKTVNDPDLYIEDKANIMLRDASPEHVRERFFGKRHPVDPRVRRYETRDIEGVGIDKPDPNEKPSKNKKEPNTFPARKKSIKKDKR